MESEVLAALIEATLASSLAIVFVLLVRVPLRRLFGARSVRAVWLLAVLAPLATLLPAPDAAAPPPAVTFVAAQGEVVGATQPAAVVDTALPWPALLLAAWAAGLLASAVLVWRRQSAFLRSLGTLTPLASDVWQAASPHGTPALVGVLAPRIVVPQDFDTRYDARERELVLAHERTHRAVGDTVVNAIATVARCVFWFNPLVHIAAGLLRFDQELACDAAVLEQHPQARRRYAEALLKTQAGPLLPIGCQWRAGAALVRRVRVLAAPVPRRTARVTGAALAVMVSFGGGVAAWAAQTPQPHSGDTSAQGFVEARIVVRPQADFGQRAPEPNAPPLVVARAGESFVVRMGEGAEVWELQAIATPRGDGQIGLQATLLYDGVVRMKHDDAQIEGKTLFMRTPPNAGSVGAVAEITLWRASDAREPAPRDPEVRAHGRVMARHGSVSDTGFFDGGVGRDFDIAPSSDSPLRIRYRIEDLTADTATIHAIVERRHADGTVERLAQPVLVTRRGTDASIRVDLQAGSDEVHSITTASSAVQSPVAVQPGRAVPPPDATDVLEVVFTVD